MRAAAPTTGRLSRSDNPITRQAKLGLERPQKNAVGLDPLATALAFRQQPGRLPRGETQAEFSLLVTPHASILEREQKIEQLLDHRASGPAPLHLRQGHPGCLFEPAKSADETHGLRRSRAPTDEEEAGGGRLAGCAERRGLHPARRPKPLMSPHGRRYRSARPRGPDPKEGDHDTHLLPCEILRARLRRRAG